VRPTPSLVGVCSWAVGADVRTWVVRVSTLGEIADHFRQCDFSIMRLEPARHRDPDPALCLGITRPLHEEIRIATEIVCPLLPDGSSRLPDSLEDQEREMIEAALAKSKGRVARPRGAAAKLGIPPSTLESKIKQLKIEKSRFTTAP